jgi:hypothetical protein
MQDIEQTPALARPARGFGVQLPTELLFSPGEALPAQVMSMKAPALFKVRAHHRLLPSCLPHPDQACQQARSLTSPRLTHQHCCWQLCSIRCFDGCV